MGQDLDLDEVSKTALHYAEVLREIEDATSRKNEDPIVSLVEAVMKKVNHAAFQRLKELGSHLHLADIIIDRAWHVVEHLFGAEDQYHLLGNRNVDVALLCTIFAVARVSDAHLTFNEIRTVYQQLALGTPEALAEIPLHHDRVGDLVAFYNEIYLPAAKTYIAEEIGSVGTFQRRFRAKETDRSLSECPETFRQDPHAPSTESRWWYGRVSNEAGNANARTSPTLGIDNDPNDQKAL